MTPTPQRVREFVSVESSEVVSVFEGTLTVYAEVGARYTVATEMPVAAVRAALAEHDRAETSTLGLDVLNALTAATGPGRTKFPSFSTCSCAAHKANRKIAVYCWVCDIMHERPGVLTERDRLVRRFLESLDLVELAAVHAQCVFRDDPSAMPPAP